MNKIKISIQKLQSLLMKSVIYYYHIYDDMDQYIFQNIVSDKQKSLVLRQVVWYFLLYTTTNSGSHFKLRQFVKSTRG